MRIGSFYGFTVPMLLLAYNDDMHKIIQNFNVSLNSITAIDFKKELWHFSKTLDNIQPDLRVKDDVLPKYANIARVIDGKIVGNVSEDVSSEIMYSMCDHCAKKLIERIRKGKDSLNLELLGDSKSIIGNLYEIVTKSMSGKSFDLSNLNPLVRAFIKNLQTEHTTGDPEKVILDLKSHFALEESLPDTFYVDDEVINLTDDEQKLLQFFVQNKKFLKEIQSSFEVKGFSEETIFDTSFIDFLNRKPTSLYYMVVKQFEHLKNSDIRLFPNILQNTKNEFSKLQKLVNSRLFIPDTVIQTISVDEVEEYFADDTEQFKSFLQDLYEITNLSEIAYDDLCNIRTMFYASKMLDIDGINRRLSSNFDNNSFSEAIRKFNKLLLGGINLYSFELFSESLREIIFTNGSKIHKTPEYLDELKQIMKDVAAFISTFKPIGGELNV